MIESDDQQLLTAFVDGGDESAFRALVERYIALAYSTARGQVMDAHLAEDVVQQTFIVLARRARRVRAPSLPAWIVSTTIFVARDTLKAQRRRRKRETQASLAMPTSSEDRAGRAMEEADASERLHAQLAQLREPHRVAV